jgi:quinolinate synthase
MFNSIAKAAAAVTLAVSLAIAGIALSTNAAYAASTSIRINPCTLTAGDPYIVYVNGVKKVQAKETLSCTAGVASVYVEQQIKESDTFPNPDDAVTSVVARTKSCSGPCTWYFTVTGPCTNWDDVGAEEMYQRSFMKIGYSSFRAQTSAVSLSC